MKIVISGPDQDAPATVINTNAEVTLQDVFSGVGIQTDQGHFGIAMRDEGIEVMLHGKHVWASGETELPWFYDRWKQHAALLENPDWSIDDLHGNSHAADSAQRVLKHVAGGLDVKRAAAPAEVGAVRVGVGEGFPTVDLFETGPAADAEYERVSRELKESTNLEQFVATVRLGLQSAGLTEAQLVGALAPPAGFDGAAALLDGWAEQYTDEGQDGYARALPGARELCKQADALREAARMLRRQSPVLAFAAAILHGDQGHRAWLLGAADCFVKGRRLPPLPAAAAGES